MKSSDSRNLPYPREQVFDALTNLDVLKVCIPGCERIDQKDDSEFSALIAVKLGPVRAKFEVGINITEAVRPQSYRATGEGKGSVVMASGTASAKLFSVDGGTRLDYEFEVKISGKIAQLGSRVIECDINYAARETNQPYMQKIRYQTKRIITDWQLDDHLNTHYNR